MITSKSNSKYKEIKKLISSSRARRQEGLFVVEGERICSEIPAGQLEELCVSESCAKSHSLDMQAVVFSDEVFRSLSDTVNPQGIMALVKMPEYSLEEIIKNAPERAMFLILDDIRDPGNLGTIIRTAEAAGVGGVILSRGCADIFNPKVIRSTMGSIFRVPFVTDYLPSAVDVLKENKTSVYAAALDADIYYNEETYEGRCAFVIGNEARGVSEEVMRLADKKIKIPMAGRVESLNAAVSAAVIMYGMKWT